MNTHSDDEVIELNRQAYDWLPCTKELSIIPMPRICLRKPVRWKKWLGKLPRGLIDT
jgi:hypothetical protein